MTLVIDASVACKWFVFEADQALALALVASGERLVAPDLIVAELCNIFWKKVRLGSMTPSQAEDAAAKATTGFSALAPCAPLGRRAMQISTSLDHPAYDCFYLALAEELALEVMTADRRLLGLVGGTQWAKHVRPLRP